MQQTAGIHIRNIPADSFEKVAAEIKRFFAELEDKPLYFDEWCKGLCLYEDRGKSVFSAMCSLIIMITT